MPDTLLIHYSPAQPDRATWALVNASGELTTMLSHGSLAEASPVASKHKTVILLDSACVHINTVKLSIKNRHKLLRAIPYALEEKIADDVEDLHFVAGKSVHDGITPVAGIKRDTLNNIIKALNDAGIEASVILPDTLCLPVDTNQWAILLHDGYADVQLDAFRGGEFDQDNLPVLLTACLQQESQQPPEKIILFSTDETTSDTAVDNIETGIREVLPDTIELVKVIYNAHPLVVFCGHYLKTMPLNLLQDAYKPRSKRSTEWQRWRLAASLVALLTCLHLGSAGTQQYSLQNKNERLNVQIEKVYKSTFPESKKIVNARVQMEQKLNELKNANMPGGDTGIITLLSESATALSSEKDITLHAINYRNNKIDFELTSTNLQAIESLNKKLNQQKIKSEIISSSSEKNLVKGNIRIERSSS